MHMWAYPQLTKSRVVLHMLSATLQGYTHVKVQRLHASEHHDMCPTLIQAFEDCNAPPKQCAPLGTLPLHEHCCNLCPQVYLIPLCKYLSDPMLSRAINSHRAIKKNTS